MARRSFTRTVRIVLIPVAVTVAMTSGRALAGQSASRTADERAATGKSRPVWVPHVRGADERARMLLAEGAARSRTFGQLLDALEASDVIIYVQTASLDGPGALLFAAATPEVRFLRILVRVSGRPNDEMIAWLGHELQHGVEVAAAPEVRDDNGMMALFQRIGFTGRSTCETKAAEHVWSRVLDEVRYGARTRRP